MKLSLKNSLIMLGVLFAAAVAAAQRAPLSADQPWQGSIQTPPRSTPSLVPDPAKTYTLPELINFAEQNNPETRVAWENAKARAAELGISKATLYPTVAAAAMAETVRTQLLFAPAYIRQTLYSFSPALELDYTVFDFGRRLDEIAVSRNNLLAANFQSIRLALAIIFHYTIRRKTLASPKSRPNAKVVALVSLALWAGVIFGGIFIGFVNDGLKLNWRL